MGQAEASVDGVFMYPIKSMGAATVDGRIPQALTVGEAGFMAYGVSDRQWLLDYDGHFVSQRGWEPGTQKSSFKDSDGQLATLQVDVQADHISVMAEGRTGGQLDIASAVPDVPQTFTKVHDNHLAVLDEGDQAARFFTKFLGRGVRLVRADPTTPRFVSELYQRPAAANRVNGADGMPFLLAAQASLNDLHKRAGLRNGSVEMARYRPNIVVDGTEAFDEDYWRRVTIGDFIADVVKPCKRCPIPNNDPLTGVYDGMSNKILGPRAGDTAVPGSPSSKGLYFAVNLNHVRSSIGAIVRRDMPFTIVGRAIEPNVALRVTS